MAGMCGIPCVDDEKAQLGDSAVLVHGLFDETRQPGELHRVHVHVFVLAAMGCRAQQLRLPFLVRVLVLAGRQVVDREAT